MYPAKGPARELPSEGRLVDRAATVLRDLDRGKLARACVAFAAPLAVAIGAASWMNWARFHDPAPWAFGHEYLTVVWQGRIHRWGLFSLHYLPRNLGVMLASLPWVPPHGSGASAYPLISGHGLALWFTTPLYVWLLWPKRATFVWWAALVAALGPLSMNLLYQNSGWVQFGYRFSNDYAIMLFVMLAVGTRRMGRAFWAAAAWGLGWNLFGAVTFDRASYASLYSHDPSAVYPPDGR